MVYGFVHDGADAHPVDGLKVSIRGRGYNRETVTDGTGFFAFVDLPAGKCRIRYEGDLPSDDAPWEVGAGKSEGTTYFRGKVQGTDVSMASDLAALKPGAIVTILWDMVVGGTDTFPDDLYVAQVIGQPIHVRLSRRPAL